MSALFATSTFSSSDALVQHAASHDNPAASNLDRLAGLVATLVEAQNPGRDDSDDEDTPASRWEEEREAFRERARLLGKFTKRAGPGGYDEYVFSDGRVMSGPIGSGYFGKTACFDAPPVFCGKREDFSDWARQMGRKLYNDTVCFPTSQLQVDYVFSRLGGRAAEHFRENLPDDPVVFRRAHGGDEDVGENRRTAGRARNAKGGDPVGSQKSVERGFGDRNVRREEGRATAIGSYGMSADEKVVTG